MARKKRGVLLAFRPLSFLVAAITWQTSFTTQLYIDIYIDAYAHTYKHAHTHATIQGWSREHRQAHDTNRVPVDSALSVLTAPTSMSLALGFSFSLLRRALLTPS